MGNLVAFEWMSADGVFDANNMEDWFFPYDSPERQKIIKKTYQEANAFLMGRTTYEMLAPYWSQLPDEEKDGVAGVLTHTPKFIASNKPSVAHWGDTTLFKEHVEAEVKKLKEKLSNIMIIGSATLAESLAQANLIDEYKLLVHPSVAGTGQHFFREGMQADMELVEAAKLDQGILLLHYRIKS